MLSNGSETHRKSRTDFAGIVKNVLENFCWMEYNIIILQEYFSFITWRITCKVSIPHMGYYNE